MAAAVAPVIVVTVSVTHLIPLHVRGSGARRGRGRGGRDGGRKGVRQATRNIALKKAVENYGPREINFEWKDQKTMLHVGNNTVLFSNFVGERLGSSRCTTRPGTISRTRRRRTSKEESWSTAQGGAPEVDVIRRRPPPNVEQSHWEAHITFWLHLKNVVRAAANAQNRARNTIFSRHGSRSLVEEIIKLRHLGANTPTGVLYTEEEICAKVIKGKQRGHIAERGRQVVGAGKKKGFGSQPRGWFPELRWARAAGVARAGVARAGMMTVTIRYFSRAPPLREEESTLHI
ncbi:hypothetical protein Tco_1304281 [Tanacetum coccineum]